MSGSIREGRVGPYADWTDFWVKKTSTFRPGQVLVQESLNEATPEQRIQSSYVSLAPFLSYQQMLKDPMCLLSDPTIQRAIEQAQSKVATPLNEAGDPLRHGFAASVLSRHFKGSIGMSR